jgi:hypothetical protein
MTLNTSVTELLQDPEPSYRVRAIEGEDALPPVLMKPMPDKEPLPSLMAILGTIPLAREAFLFRDHVRENYGSDRQWWSGTSIEFPRLLVEGDDEQADLDDRHWDVICETQRLVAFMHASKRSYGSVEPLTKLKGLKALRDIISPGVVLNTQAHRFLWGWSNAANVARDSSGSNTTKSYADLFLTTAAKASPKEDSELSFRLIELKLSSQSPEKTRTLYDALDDLIWNDLDSEEQDYGLTTTAPVFVVQVRNLNTGNKGLGLSVPHTLYLDRYLEEHRADAKFMRDNIADCRNELKAIEERKKKLQSTEHLDGKSISVKDMITSSIAFLNPPPGSDDGEVDADKDPEEVASHKEVAAQLEALYQFLEKKVQGKSIGSASNHAIANLEQNWMLNVNRLSSRLMSLQLYSKAPTTAPMISYQPSVTLSAAQQSPTARSMSTLTSSSIHPTGPGKRQMKISWLTRVLSRKRRKLSGGNCAIQVCPG